MTGSWLPIAIVLTSAVPGLFIFFLGERRVVARTTLNFAGAISKVLLLGVALWGVWRGASYETRVPWLPGLDFVLRADAPALLFGALSGLLWLLTTVYAVAYLEGSPNRRRFFGFFSLCVSASMGVALAGNLVTFLLFYELLTLTTWPLVVHRGTEKALRAGRTYVAYTLGGSALLLAGVVWIHALGGPIEFAARGTLAGLGGRTFELRAIFALMAAGIGVKAALVPLHGWLPRAMVAPAPVSALLHAVAVVKAGAFGIVRLVYDVFGIEFAAGLGVLAPLAAVAAVTIVWGSFRALSQDELKKRLAYSTVSQVSYIVLGTAIVGQISTVGGLVHLVHQGIMKITLFFCAGNLAETLGVHAVSELRGAGRRMPLTMGAFTVAALGMIGLPPMAGFASKWYLGVGGLEAGDGWVVLVLATSTLLNAAYFLPILRKAWFEPPPTAWPHEVRFRHETSLGLLVPPLVTALLVVLAGLFAGTGASPVSWAKLVVAREYAASAVVPALPLARPEGLAPSCAALGLVVPAALAFAAALLAAVRPAGRGWRWVGAAAAALATAVALAGPSGPLELPGLLLGVRPGLDVAGRAALLLAGAVLGLALLRHAAPAGDPAAAWTALLAAGVASTAVAFDAGALALGFVALVFAAYGLAARRGADGAAAAGRFMAFAVLGEVLLVDALAELGLSARSSGIEAMRAAIDAEVGAGAAGLLLAAAYGLPLALVGLRGPVLPTLAFAGAGAMAILRIVPRQGGAVEALTPLLLMVGFGAAAALVARFLPTRGARPDASAAGHGQGHGHGHGDEPAPAATDLAARLPSWLGTAEQGLGRLAGSGLLALLLVAALALLLR